MKLIKTSIKGLYLTTEGKAWRKDFNIELKATTNGKVRFNGKLYSLQKLIAQSSQKTTINKVVKPKDQKKTKAKTKTTSKKRTSLRELQIQGFKKTQINGLFVSKNGEAYNYDSDRFLSPTTKGTVIKNGKGYNLAKLILEVFCNIENRSGQINFINGNDKDFSFENLEYKSSIKQPPPVAPDLIKCIRFYFEVEQKLNRKSLMTKFYLYEIIKTRCFDLKYKGLDFDLFLDYFKNDYYILSDSQNTVFDKFNYTAINGKNAINKYLNLLINECLQDFDNGLLKVKDFKPKPPTKTDKLRALQKKVNDYGFNVKIPLRKKSNKEILRDYEKASKETDLKIESLKNKPPQ